MEGGQNPDLEKVFDVGGFGYPVSVMVSLLSWGGFLTLVSPGSCWPQPSTQGLQCLARSLQ